MQWWKVLGVAAFVGVAATGVLVARSERRHHDYTVEEIRERLHARAAEALASPPAVVAAEGAVGAAAGEAPEVLVGADGPAAEAVPDVAPHPSSLRRRAAGARRRVVGGVTHVRTALGVRPLPTRRRRRAERHHTPA